MLYLKCKALQEIAKQEKEIMNRITKMLASGAMALALTAGISVATVAPANAAEAGCVKAEDIYTSGKAIPIDKLPCDYTKSDAGRTLFADRTKAVQYAINGNVVAARRLMIKDITSVTLPMAYNAAAKKDIIDMANMLVNQRTTTGAYVIRFYSLLEFHAAYYGKRVANIDTIYTIMVQANSARYAQALTQTSKYVSAPFLGVYMKAVAESEGVVKYVNNYVMFQAYFDRSKNI